jgi:hypothetical protein
LNALNRHRNWVFLLLAILLTGLFVARAGGGFPLDDSWIHQSYGRNLGLSGEWSLIPGQPSAASTAPLYTVLLAVGYAIRIPYAVWTHVLGVLALWGIGVAGANLADRIAPNLRYSGLLAGFLLVTTWQLVWAAASGMETALFAMWVTLLPLLAWRETDEDRSRDARLTLLRGFVFGAVAALAVLTRPEGIVMASLCGLALLIVRPAGSGLFVIWVVGAAVGFGLFITPYLWLNLTLAGGLLPNTSAAKQVQHEPLLALPFYTRLWEMFLPLFIGGQVFLIPGILAYLVGTGRDPNTRPWLRQVLPLWLLGLVALYAARLPASYQHGRYVMPALPALVIIGSIGLRHLVKMGRTQLIGRVLTQTALMAAIVSFVVMAVGVGPGVYARDVAVINEEMVASARWIDENISPDEFLAIHDIGAVAYFTPRPILDIAGLVSPEAIPFINEPDGLWDLMQERGAVYLMAFPDQIPGDDPEVSVLDPRLCVVFTTNGPTAIALEAKNMSVYQLAWDGDCSQ